MKATRKIGILGGTFDPVHRIHIKLATEAKEQFGLEEVWLMPSGDPPHKAGKHITPGNERLHMLTLALEGEPGLLASDYELRRSGKIYTAETLTMLSEDYPEVSWYFILGGDSLLYLDQWYHPEEIFAHAVILVAVRDNQDKKELWLEPGSCIWQNGCYPDSVLLAELEEKRRQLLAVYPEADIRWLQGKADNLSSSVLRELLCKTEPTADEEKLLQEALPAKVYSYIMKHSFYTVN